MLKKVIILAVASFFIIMNFNGCKGNVDSSNKTTGTKKENSTINSTTTEGSETQNILADPLIDTVDSFKKEETTLQESDIIVVYIRNVSYDESAKRFEKNLFVYLNDTEKLYHDVKPVGANYYQLTVDLPEGVSSGNVYVYYSDVKSNVQSFTLD
ncbi:MAG: hypothetical protein PHV32_05330 [Eubacteriales bacterium]|nr:hypothetical protein [Eubacteriales bacterium]